ncbi:MAG: citrate lyase acyl carrier protein [Lentilactobacillus diolivorans]|jgi:citrate lyase subunit gamma (acyl carrier protein)|uniref:Citrate lyase acyl carrier protein n=2 Tax=Lentilactobacillus diolivorans TaxID=179838 RepID=A0A0R1SIT1_9LACO|nr:citrate lyase acyl carrier protein [Lentilactobacillus diolivorans]RRG04383.1 MAG: citrate lyase acyl carrier protein [Lactobacillus sp.]KRL69103.1 citrate lyase acyl carrier protein [Lentilactobacillus diolivorans DSM 14421]MCH4163601.1 citrate lyase acyl carrier protein [Lentilactobacillus diolivorans]MDH5104590.1 citrate lyase acyl carrier protein [Lentilactobacillus diolivorans]GEP22450.1 citrate lyase acyl carrier protein [Lentilactobacillus diolivorans]
MEIKQTAVAGTLESSDIQIMLSKGNDGIQIDLESDVKKQFGDQIESVITETLKKFDIDNAKVKAVDKGALDCVIKARTIAVAQRALKTADQPAWEVL